MGSSNSSHSKSEIGGYSTTKRHKSPSKRRQEDSGLKSLSCLTPSQDGIKLDKKKPKKVSEEKVKSHQESGKDKPLCKILRMKTDD